jgi:hypothetical protein
MPPAVGLALLLTPALAEESPEVPVVLVVPVELARSLPDPVEELPKPLVGVPNPVDELPKPDEEPIGLPMVEAPVIPPEPVPLRGCPKKPIAVGALFWPR